MRAVRNRLRRIAGAAALVTGLAGILIRLTVQDSFLASGIVFYATPWPVLACLLAAGARGIAGAAPGTSRRRLGRAALLAAAAAAVISVATGWSMHRCVQSGRPVRVLFWNCAHGRFGWESIAAEIRATDADLIGLVEAGPRTPVRERFWRRRFPEYTIWLPGREIVLMVRGDIETARAHDLEGRGDAAAARVRLRGEPVLAVVADLHSSPVMRRDLPMQKLGRLMEGPSDRPRILMGDFNTPSDTAHMTAVRRAVHPAFDLGGTGWRPTWPVPLPVLDLDQIWVSEAIEPSCVRTRWTRLSDHAQVLAEIRLPAREIPSVSSVQD